MSDEFTNNVAQKVPNTLGKDSIEKPWDVTGQKIISPVKNFGEEPKREELTERIHTLYSELRSKVIEMLRVMEEYMKERIK